MSVSGCLSVASFRLPSQNKINFRKQAVGGSLFFGFFLLAKQKKETRQSGESDVIKIANIVQSTYDVANANS